MSQLPLFSSSFRWCSRQRRVFQWRQRRKCNQTVVVGASGASSSSSSEEEKDEEAKRLVFNPAAMYNEIFCDDKTFSKDVSRKIAKEVTELRPETYRNPEDSFYGEIDVNSMLELIDLGTDGKNLDGGLRYVDLGCGVGKQVAVRLIWFYVVLFELILLLRSFSCSLFRVFLSFSSVVLTFFSFCIIDTRRRRRCRGSLPKRTAWRFVRI